MYYFSSERLSKCDLACFRKAPLNYSTHSIGRTTNYITISDKFIDFQSCCLHCSNQKGLISPINYFLTIFSHSLKRICNIVISVKNNQQDSPSFHLTKANVRMCRIAADGIWRAVMDCYVS